MNNNELRNKVLQKLSSDKIPAHYFSMTYKERGDFSKAVVQKYIEIEQYQTTKQKVIKYSHKPISKSLDFSKDDDSEHFRK